MKFRFLSFLFFFAISTMVFSQPIETGLRPANPAEVGMSADHLSLLDDHIQKYVEDGIVPGGVFLVTRKGKIVYYKNFGHTTLDKKEQYEKDDIFRLASMTKAITTVAVMQLFEKGKLGLDDPIFYYIPAFAQSKVLDTFNEVDSTFTTVPAKRAITIRHLLTHSSGITYGLFNPGKIQMIYTKMGCNNFGISNDEVNTEQMVNQLATLPLIFNPGDKYMYGYNMEILGRIIEVVSGMPLNQYFKKNILNPLGMDDTRFYYPKEKHHRIVPVYTYNEKKEVIMAADTESGGVLEFPKLTDNNHYAGGGGMSGTAMDYAKLTQVLMNGGTYNGQRILGRKTIEVMTSDQLMLQNAMGTGYSKLPGLSFGLGFAVKTEGGTAWNPKSEGTFEWGGYFNTKFFIDPVEELTFVGMTQIVPFRRPDFWNRMYAIIYGAVEN